MGLRSKWEITKKLYVEKEVLKYRKRIKSQVNQYTGFSFFRFSKQML